MGGETVEPIFPNVRVSPIYNPPSNLTLNVDGPPASFDIDIGSAASETAFHQAVTLHPSASPFCRNTRLCVEIGLLAQHDIEDDFEIV